MKTYYIVGKAKTVEQRKEYGRVQSEHNKFESLEDATKRATEMASVLL